ncbi:MAG: hypothetical protein OXI70_07110 [Chloroflexota bacterium]|nr:hypothetical protein [Rhodospirillaceae bacterium]MDE2767843.1 hypothetical protein [Chloroflexota bacterium]
MITLEHDRLVFRFPEVHQDARCAIAFQRTLRIPDDGLDYPLPPGMGSFPLRHVDDYARRVPEDWLRRGGVLMPMHQAEAMWINFHCRGYPFAVKIATGKICALTGEGWMNHLNTDPQDYAVLPEQPWLDGYCVAKGIVRQFVAMPLGQGYTVEEQLTGEAEHGGLQLIVYPMKAERYEEMMSVVSAGAPPDEFVAYGPIKSEPMGLAPGGRMQQEVYEDEYGLDAWDQRHASRCFVTIANSVQWMALTGERPPTEPPSPGEYAAAGLPWFDYFVEDLTALEETEKLRGIASVAQLGAANGESPLPENESVSADRVIPLRRRVSNQVREMFADSTLAG